MTIMTFKNHNTRKPTFIAKLVKIQSIKKEFPKLIS